MSEQPTSARLARKSARVIAILVAVASAILAAYWLSRFARDLPDAYSGEVRGGLSLSLAMLAGSAGQLVERPRVRIPLAIISLLFVMTAMYFSFGGQPACRTGKLAAA